MRFQDIELPLELFKQINFADKIEKSNEEACVHVDFLKKLIDKNHEQYVQIFKEIRKLVPKHESKIQNSKGFLSDDMVNFIKTMMELAQVMETQVSKNIIYLTSKKYQGVRKMRETIRQKLIKAG